MFEQSVVEPRGLAARPWTLAMSIAGQAALVSAAVLVPLLHPDVLQRVSLWIPLGAPPACQPPVAHKVDVARVVTARRPFPASGFFAPRSVPDRILLLQDDPAPPIVGASSGRIDGVPGGLGAPGGGSPILSQLLRLPPVAPPPAAPPAAPPAPKAPEPIAQIRRGGEVQAALLLHGPKPAYPPLARQARIAGSVHLAAVIGADGRVLDLRARDGHPLLVSAAIEAVRHWLYRPTTLNGSPVEVVTEITVTFVLN